MGCTSSTPASKPVVAGHIVTSTSGHLQANPIRPNNSFKSVTKKAKETKFQWYDGKTWRNYDDATDKRLKMAYSVGHRNAKFKLKTKSSTDEYSFLFGKNKMTQKNLSTGKIRMMRPPLAMPMPASPLLPEGDFVVIKLAESHVGQNTMNIKDPQRSGDMITVSLPADAKKGQKIAIPVPSKGESVADVARKQQGMNLGRKIKIGLGVSAVAGAGVVGGVILYDYLDGGFVDAENHYDYAGDLPHDDSVHMADHHADHDLDHHDDRLPHHDMDSADVPHHEDAIHSYPDHDEFAHHSGIDADADMDYWGAADGDWGLSDGDHDLEFFPDGDVDWSEDKGEDLADWVFSVFD